MTFIIKNPHPHVVKVGLVEIEPYEQLDVNHLTDEMNAALDRGDIIISGNADLSQAEAKADVDAYKEPK